MSDLKVKNVEFPPSFFLQAYQPFSKIYLKRDMHRVKKIAKEFEQAIHGLHKEKSILLRKIIIAYEKSLHFEIDHLKNIGKNINKSILSALNSINEAKRLFNY